MYRYIVLLVLVASTAYGSTYKLFEDNVSVLNELTGNAVVSPDYSTRSMGQLSAKVYKDGGLDGQVYNSQLWSYNVVASPVSANEIRWIRFAWKKDGSNAIMIEFAADGQWGIVTTPYVVPPAPGTFRYVAGGNPTGWSGIQVSNYAPTSWTTVIRDLYADFGEFKLTGMAWTPFSDTAWFDSIYVASTYQEIVSIGMPVGQTMVEVIVPDRVNEDSEFYARVRVKNAIGVAGFGCNVLFNDEVLKYRAIEEGNFLKSGCSTYWMAPDEDDGLIRDIASVRTCQSAISGSGELFAIKFKARDVGESVIELRSFVLGSSTGASLPVVITNATVTVIESPRWDVNRDGRVDVMDLIIIGQYYGKVVSSLWTYNPDVNGNGKVDVQDLILVARQYGEVYWSGGAPAVKGLSAQARLRLREVYGYLVRDGGDEDSIKLVQKILEKLPTTALTTWGGRKSGRVYER